MTPRTLVRRSRWQIEQYLLRQRLEIKIVTVEWFAIQVDL
jgi:hypothetical protein